MNPLTVSALSISIFLALYLAVQIALKVLSIQFHETKFGQALAFVVF